MNFKEGIKRIFVASGYLLFMLLGWLFGIEEGSFYAQIIAPIIGFYIFKGILYGINWIIAGFTDKDTADEQRK